MKRIYAIGILAVMIAVAAHASEEATRPHAGMLRYPDVSASSIVFVYANDLWIVPREGGMASPLASPPGQELFPRFSPDGKFIAFIGNYDGDRDVYTVPVEGGVPTRITHHPANEILCDWTPQNKLLFFSNGLAGLPRQEQLFLVDPKGGLPERIPVPYGANGAIGFSGEWMAYTPFTRDFRTWKRYRGGWATDVWLFNLKNFASEKITSWEGTDTYPMWWGDKVYYLSDMGADHRLNIWSYNTTTKERRQVTDFGDYDCKFPAAGPGDHGEGEIVFQNGANLYLLNLATEKVRSVIVMIPGARPKIRPQRIKVNDRIQDWSISPTGKRIVVEARGDIWTLPAKDGAAIDLTRTSNAAERDPQWSPDGQWIAYFSDASGEYELITQQSDGKGETKQLTSGGAAFRYSPYWSPDSKRIAFSDKTGSIYIHTIENKETQFVDKDPWANVDILLNWSHDSSWLAYAKSNDNSLNSIWLYNVKEGKNHRVTSDLFDCSYPAFDRKGDFLYYTSNQRFSDLVFDKVGWSYVYPEVGVLMAAPLRKDVKNPFLSKSDEESWDKKKESEKAKEGDKASGESISSSTSDAKMQKPILIDLDGFEQRAFPLPVGTGGFERLAVNDSGKLIYVHSGLKANGGKTDIKIFDPADEKKEEKNVLADTDNFAMSADGKKLVVRKGDNFHIVDAAADQKLENPISTGDMETEIDPRAEWRQMVKDGWRIMRDYFYDPNMHRVDWQKTYNQYAKMLDDCASREDVNFVIDEMIAELNVGHAYNRGNPDLEDEPSESVGMLGVDFALNEGAYRISKIYRGAPWDYDARNPLDALNEGDLKEGDFILAVNRQPIDTSKDPWAAFIGLADKTATLTVSNEPKLNEKARDVVVKLRSNETNLRYRTWIENNRAYIDKKTDGKVGYIYVSNTAAEGNNDLFRQYYGQRQKEALIIDDRWNGGGFIPSRMIELLNRPVLNYWARRDGKDWPWPPDSHSGPKCMLINALAASGGDAFPWYFRQLGLGKLIGTRTWGGLVGISGNPSLIDGGQVIAPTFGFYENNGTWGIEGHGVDPDIEIIDNPTLMANGGDPQVDAAISLMMQEIKTHPYIPPKRPPYPDRSGMGIREEDK